MGRSVARGAFALSHVKKFLAALALNDDELCEVTRDVVMKKRRQLMGRQRGKVSEEAFLKALPKVGANKKRVRRSGGRMVVWCLLCTHTTRKNGTAKKTPKQEEEEEEEEEKGKEKDEPANFNRHGGVEGLRHWR